MCCIRVGLDQVEHEYEVLSAPLLTPVTLVTPVTLLWQHSIFTPKPLHLGGTPRDLPTWMRYVVTRVP